VDFALTGDVMVVGRDQAADICVDEPLVSRTHARIERRGESYFVIDLGSTNLTRVNDQVIGEHELADGDELRFARARCRFVSRPANDPVIGGV
jgi:pSer/pThr/pTyr-binding forkhead associated (FHA) protein